MPGPASAGFAPEAHITAWRRLMRGAADRRQRGAVAGPAEAGSRHLRSAPTCVFLPRPPVLPFHCLCLPTEMPTAPGGGFEGRGRWTN
jgi:hypothetical protein